MYFVRGKKERHRKKNTNSWWLNFTLQSTNLGTLNFPILQINPTKNNNNKYT